MNDPIFIDRTPNVVIKNSNIRFVLGAILFGAGLLSGIASLFYLFFPELAGDAEIPTRAIAFLNAVISFLSNAFGISVFLPNVPRNLDNVES